MSRDYYTEDGYPTEEALERLCNFEGTAGGMAEYIAALMKNGSGRIDHSSDAWNRPRKKLTLITMGWSGCESVIGALHDTLFHFAFWELSARGGLFVYQIPDGLWGSESKWGKV